MRIGSRCRTRRGFAVTPVFLLCLSKFWCVVYLYGLPQLMEQFGLRLPIAQAAMVEHEKMNGNARGNVNFSFRTVCNMRKCNTPKSGSQVAKPAKSSKADMPEGSRKCDKYPQFLFGCAV
ncbi:zinc finger, RanBP2-type [Artemisia annua]|uniref:Zinc finger, RanBP2-type n=1 Tax=Artemisia annua TaxID=35608 RepID=A0A2U1PQ30_ARTAN|nr:zinc finger, RanBP2-type [Artemisia annua]